MQRGTLDGAASPAFCDTILVPYAVVQVGRVLVFVRRRLVAVWMGRRADHGLAVMVIVVTVVVLDVLVPLGRSEPVSGVRG